MDRDTATATLAQLHRLGVQLHIDDFGTGYASLSVLHHLPIDTLKIDRAFVRPLGVTGERHAIARTIMLLARELGLTVIAEGVETAEHVAQLTALGGDYGQGYWFAKPLESSAAEALVTAEPWHMTQYGLL
jgi:EAL domain-containing protein (putative c-di-GMP-specific phosphodiesterase class I)